MGEYPNGQIPLSARTTINNGQTVLNALAPQTKALCAAFEKHFGKTLTITDGYRSLVAQIDAFQRNYTTFYESSAKIDKKWWNGKWWWRRLGRPSTAIPGNSNHGWGRALDLGSGVNTSLYTPEHKWMREHGPKFGWYHPLWAHDPARVYMHEPWHFEAEEVAVPVARYSSFLSSVGVTAPTTSPVSPILHVEEDDMQGFALRNYNGSIGLVQPDGTLDPLNIEDWNALLRSGYVDGYKQEPDGTVWNILTGRTARLRAVAPVNVDTNEVATKIAALLVPAVIEGLPEGVLTQADVEAASEVAIRRVLGSLKAV